MNISMMSACTMKSNPLDVLGNVEKPIGRTHHCSP